MNFFILKHSPSLRLCTRAVLSHRWEYNVRHKTCRVRLNGQLCNSCQRQSCKDGFIGKAIDCTNVLLPHIPSNDNKDDHEVDPLVYNSCESSNANDNGVLDIVGWVEKESYTGCPFVPVDFYD